MSQRTRKRTDEEKVIYKLNEENQKQYDKYKKDLSEKEKALSEKLDILRKYGFESREDYLNAGARAEREEDIEKLSKTFATRYLSTFTCSENLPVGGDGAKTYLSMEQMNAMIRELKKKDIKTDPVFLSTLEEVIKHEHDALYQKLQANAKGTETIERIKEVTIAMINAFMEHAEENEVLNYEHFSGHYSKQADDVFDMIKESLTKRKSIVASTYKFTDDMAEDMDTGEKVFNGIASTHAYSIMGVKTLKEKNPSFGKDRDDREFIVHKFVRVRNPWGLLHSTYEKNNAGKVELKTTDSAAFNGYDEIELNDFMKRFYKVDIAGVPTKTEE